VPAKLRAIAGSEELEMLARVLEDALKVVVNGQLPFSPVELDQLKTQLGQIIMDGYTAGQTDPEALKQVAVESVGAR
jgi:hypothetical protein